MIFFSRAYVIRIASPLVYFCCLAFLSACGGGSKIPTNTPFGNNEEYLNNNYNLVYEDDFSGNQLSANWYSRAEGPRKLGYVDPNNIEVSDGTLKLHVTKESDGSFHTGMIRSHQGHLYGYFEARMKFPLDYGIQSAFWMTSPTYHDGDNDVNLYGAEIDVIEQLTKDPNTYHHTIHWDGYAANHKKEVQRSVVINPGGWHLFGVEWTPQGYTFFVDGAQAAHIRSGISTVPQVLDLSTEVTSWSGVPSASFLADALEIDYVKVYSRN